LSTFRERIRIRCGPWFTTARICAGGWRNIFVFYEPPKVIPTIPVTPTPTPTPTPPVLLASLSPASVFARTADFNLEITGDKIIRSCA